MPLDILLQQPLRFWMKKELLPLRSPVQALAEELLKKMPSKPRLQRLPRLSQQYPADLR